ncbi:MAG TPA: hypothetical protein VJ976_02205 [Ornithinimicrobium sp.]|uniref:hypothetical protein n=1 Tax=Ornithinimicrobium sp. TaxID=1977084 RepID=UPI002B468EF1|nr:hypothetical protein [Ornithinimicrobium sp.]HKJ11182.1 hypothetical protein [Ornithinimicrobium sp.]
MSTTRPHILTAGPLPWLSVLLVVLGAGAMATSLLGPLALGVIGYHASPGAVDQVRGGDLAGLLLVGPVALWAARLVAAERPGAEALAMAPGSYGLYMYTQLSISGDIAQYDGNTERWFPLFWALIVASLGVLVLAGQRLALAPTPARRPRLERVAGWYLLTVAAFLTVGIHLPGLVDLWQGSPVGEEYLADAVVFWTVKVMDLAFVLPLLLTVGIGLLRVQAWARALLAPVVGWCALLASSVAGMGVAMVLTGAPGAAAGLAAGVCLVAVAALVLAVLAYHPLLGTAVPGREASSPATPEPRAG